MSITQWIDEISILLPHFGWRSVVDIFVIATILFFLYRTFRTTGTWKIILGILFAGMVFLASLALNLKGVTWIFSNLSEIFLIALVIVFQPEIRRLLEKVATLRKWKRKKGSEDLAHSIASALHEMAQKKIGAIIVFPGNEAIQDWVSGGTECDGKPTVPLLLSIFDHHSPGHDGAVILDRGRIQKFGTRLPVSESGTLGERYGTRHHASMGMSEKTDSLVLTVSEERGEITVFYQGSKRSVHAIEELRDEIEKHWKRAEVSAPFVRQSRNRVIQFAYQFSLSLMVAFLLWAGVVRSENETIYRTFPVDVLMDASSDGFLIESYRPDGVDLTVSSSMDRLNGFDAKRVAVRIPANKLSPGTNTFEIERSMVESLPAGISFYSVKPDTVTVVARPIRELRAKVQVRFTGELPEGKSMTGYQVLPPTIRVFAEGQVEKTTNQASKENPDAELSSKKKEKRYETILETQPIALDQIEKSQTVRTRLIIPEGIWPVGGQWPDVEVELQIDD